MVELNLMRIGGVHHCAIKSVCPDFTILLRLLYKERLDLEEKPSLQRKNPKSKHNKPGTLVTFGIENKPHSPRLE